MQHLQDPARALPRPARLIRASEAILGDPPAHSTAAQASADPDCYYCGGRGVRECGTCDGRGWYMGRDGERQRCDACGGSGEIRCQCTR